VASPGRPGRLRVAPAGDHALARPARADPQPGASPRPPPPVWWPADASDGTRPP